MKWLTALTQWLQTEILSHSKLVLMGDYNIDNLLGVIAALRAMGVSLPQAVKVCSELNAVPGRMEKVSVQGNDATWGDSDRSFDVP